MTVTDAAIPAAIADREGAWERVLEGAAEFEASWQREMELHEELHRRRLERVRLWHELSESAAEASGS